MSKVIGRETEIKILESSKSTDQPELIAIYGKRRVGKTFLIREYYKRDIIFEITGLLHGTFKDQLGNFTKELKKRQKNIELNTPINWLEAFTLLEKYLDKKRSKGKKVVFIDEFPWIATPRSKFLMAFENFWNHYATRRNDLILIICGSAASYMVKNIINNKGGLYNRITRKIRLLPFNLYETSLFLKSKGINYTQYDIAQLYMTIGGIPHYLENLEKGNSVAQNIDKLCFEKDGILHEEFNKLYVSLFDNSDRHLKIIRVLSSSRKGLTRQDIIDKSEILSSGDFSLKLLELIESGFVSEYSYFKNKKQLTLYRLSDEYSMFYLKFIENIKGNGTGQWQRFSRKQSYKIWSGFAFETLCLKHINQIKSALGIDAICSANSCWFNNKAQIDLLIDRDDNIINLCEMKFHNTPFTIDKKYYWELKNKLDEFHKATQSRKNLYFTFITTFGLNKNAYSNELVQNSLGLDSIFKY